MMPVEHHQMAEQLLDEAAQAGADNLYGLGTYLATRAQAHATLATGPAPVSFDRERVGERVSGILAAVEALRLDRGEHPHDYTALCGIAQEIKVDLVGLLRAVGFDLDAHLRSIGVK